MKTEKFTGRTANGSVYTVSSVSGQNGKVFAAVPAANITQTVVAPGSLRGLDGVTEGLVGRLPGKSGNQFCIPWTSPGLRDWWEALQAEQEAAEQEAARIAAETPWPNFTFRMGCDTANTCHPETHSDLLNYRADWRGAADVIAGLGRADLEALQESSDETDLLPGDLGSYYGLRIAGPLAQRLWIRNQERKNQERQNQEQQNQAKEAFREECFREARETGQRVKLASWTEECSDQEEECNLDSVIEYALPNGNAQEERHHTW